MSLLDRALPPTAPAPTDTGPAADPERGARARFAFPPSRDGDDALERVIDWIYASLNERGRLTHGQRDAERRSPAWTRALLDALGAPDQGLPALFVTGSKGKGSTSVLAAASLMAGTAGGAPVGLVTSPHLVRFEERIRVDLEAIPGKRLRTLVETVRPLADVLRARMPLPLYASPVGTVAALAALHFRILGARYAVYEAGRGGRFDDTAEIEHAVTVITTLFPEHLRELGPTLRDIAWHKAGAIREGTRVVVQGRFPPELDTIVQKEARSVGAQVLTLGQEVTVATEPGRDGRLTARVTTPLRTYEGLPVPFAGRHQADNLALALAAAEALAGGPLRARPLASMLTRIRWPGRLDTVQDPAGGPALLDASIEPGAALAAVAHAREHLPGPHAVLVGIGVGKDYRAVWDALSASPVDVIVTRARNPYLRFPDPGETLEWAGRDPAHRDFVADLPSAWEKARTRVGPSGTVLVLGTVSLIADALELCGQDAYDLRRPREPKGRPSSGRL